MSEFLRVIRRELESAVQERDGVCALLPLSVAEIAFVMRTAREHDQRITVPGGAPRDGAVYLDLRRMADVVGIDDTSRLVHVQAGASVGVVEDELRRRGLSLGLENVPDHDIGTWLAIGAPGARDPDDDPVDQLVAGLEAVLPDGMDLRIRPAPRRAVGPDLIGAMVGARGRLGVIVSAHLVVRPRQATEELAYLFPSLDRALAARAWIRGRGVRPTAAHVTSVAEGAALRIRVETDGPLAAANRRVIDATVRSREGVAVPLHEAPPVPEPTERPSSATVAALARRLDPHALLG